MDYIMPIITEGYLSAIRRTEANSEDFDALASWDERYARLIYSLMNSEYVDNGCSNKRFACVIPEEVNIHNIVNKIRCQPVLKTWTKECNIELFVKNLLK